MKNRKSHSNFKGKKIFSILIGLTLLASAGLVSNLYLSMKNPFIIDSQLEKMGAHVIAADHESSTALFYFILNLPKNFNHQPVQFQISYKKGPPNHFISQIETQLAPDITLTFEGPKTPSPTVTRGEIRPCLTESQNWNCLALRQSLFERWVSEPSPSSHLWHANWFQIDDLTLPTEEQTQGVHLRADLDQEILDQYIVIQPSGTQQVIRLKRPRSPSGESAYELTSRILASIRVYPDLTAGRELVSRRLEEVRLEAIKNEADTARRRERLNDTQLLLISKISVDPGNLDSYFHLAGTSTWMPEAKMAQRNLESAYLYARDIAPLDPRTSQIQAFWLTASSPRGTQSQAVGVPNDNRL